MKIRFRSVFVIFETYIQTHDTCAGFDIHYLMFRRRKVGNIYYISHQTVYIAGLWTCVPNWLLHGMLFTFEYINSYTMNAYINV